MCCLLPLPEGPPYRQRRLHAPDSAAAFFHEAPLLIKFQGLGREAVHVLIMAPLGLAPSHPPQASDGLWGHVHEPGGGPHTTPFPHMVADLLRGGLWALGVEHGGATALGALLPTPSTAQQADTVMPLHCPADEVMRPGVAQQLACGMDTGERVQVGSRHEDLLETSSSLSQALHPARPRWSTPL